MMLNVLLVSASFAGERCNNVVKGNVYDLIVISSESGVYQVFRVSGSGKIYAAISGSSGLALLNGYEVSIKIECDPGARMDPVIQDQFPGVLLVDIVAVVPKGILLGISKRRVESEKKEK